VNKKALEHFKKNDPVLYKLALSVEISELISPPDYFVDMVESIISQQLSIKASDTIFARFKFLFPEGKIVPELLLKIPDKKIRTCGISYSKISYIKGIAEALVKKQIDFKKLVELPDEEVIKELVKLKGVGRWTAEMFLMFTLLRDDIFSAGDLGLRNAILKHYKLKRVDEKKVLKISSKWSPHRTIASRILWKSLDTK